MSLCGLGVPVSAARGAGPAPAAALHWAWTLPGQNQNPLFDLEDEEPAQPAAKKPSAPEPAAKPPGEPAEPAAKKPAATAPLPGLEEEEEEPPPAKPAPKPAGPSPSGQPPTTTDGEGRAAPRQQICDTVYVRLGRAADFAPRRVRLLPELIRPPFPPAREYEFAVLSDRGSGYQIIRPSGREINAIIYYEEQMLRRAAELFGTDAGELAQEGRVFEGLDNPQRAEAANRTITLLQEAIAEHDSAVQRLVRRGPGWTELRAPLAQAWFNLQISLVLRRFQQGLYPQATAACDQLLDHPAVELKNQLVIFGLLEKMLLDPAMQAVERREFAAARQLLDEYARRCPQGASTKAHAVRVRMVEIARSLADRALAEKNAALLESAAEVWPQLPGLNDLRRQIVTSYPILCCAYPSLPQGLSPLTARTLVDRHAVSLMFESLMRWRQDPQIGPHYANLLADERPLPLARGRQFRLPRCIWFESPTGEPARCLVEDVAWTVQLLKRLHPPGYSRAWDRLLLPVETSETDPFHVALRLDRDHWQPLSLMDFVILPKAAFPQGGTDKELEAFDRQPLGTGPYRLGRWAQDQEIRFVANPFYRRPGLPHIREIAFQRLDSIESHEAFVNGKVQLIFGVRPTQVVQLRSQGQKVVKIPTPSVCFLAPNYRLPHWQDADLRLALAHAVPRDTILNTCFRPGGSSLDHAPLTGPYPAKSWACNPLVPPFTPDAAQACLARARERLRVLPAITLIYPDRDPEVAAACTAIKEQWQARLQLEVTITPVEPALFHQRVLDRHQFDLAYWRHDFPDETYSIWPWFDPDDRNPGGANFMGFVPDDDLRDMFHKLEINKQFNTIRQTAREIHRALAARAVLIPLWQLETYVAVSPQLQLSSFDPFTFFADVQFWKLVPR